MLTVHNTEAIRRIEEAIGYTFRDKRLLVQVFTRKTYMKIDPEAPDNEVLEFYGDMLLSYHVTTYFVEKFAHMLDDGLYFMRTVEQFTEMRSHYVRNQYLTDRVRQLIPNIERLVRAQNPRIELPKDNQKAYADLFESLVGAVYLDSWRDDKLIRTFILRHLNLEPKVAPEAPAARGIRTLPRVDISSIDRLPDTDSDRFAADATPDDEAPALPDAADPTEEPDIPSDDAPIAPPHLPPVRSTADDHTRTEEADDDDLPTAIPDAEPAPQTSGIAKKSYRKTTKLNDESGARTPETAKHATPAPADTRQEERDEPAPVVESHAPAGSKRAELEAYCAELAYEAPVFNEMPPNAPHARPVASCTLRFRDARGKSIKISLNDSGRTMEDALEKSAAKMLKKLLSHRDNRAAKKDYQAKAVDPRAAMIVPAEPFSELPAEITEAVAVIPAEALAEVVAEIPFEIVEVAAEVPAEVVEAAAEVPAEVVEAAAEVPAEVAEAVAELPAEVVEAAAELPAEVAEEVTETGENADFHRERDRGSTVENRAFTVDDFSQVSTEQAYSDLNEQILTTEPTDNALPVEPPLPTPQAEAEVAVSTRETEAEVALPTDPEQLTIDTEEEPVSENTTNAVTEPVSENTTNAVIEPTLENTADAGMEPAPESALSSAEIPPARPRRSTRSGGAKKAGKTADAASQAPGRNGEMTADVLPEASTEKPTARATKKTPSGAKKAASGEKKAASGEKKAVKADPTVRDEVTPAEPTPTKATKAAGASAKRASKTSKVSSASTPAPATDAPEPAADPAPKATAKPRRARPRKSSGGSNDDGETGV